MKSGRIIENGIYIGIIIASLGWLAGRYLDFTLSRPLPPPGQLTLTLILANLSWIIVAAILGGTVELIVLPFRWLDRKWLNKASAIHACPTLPRSNRLAKVAWVLATFAFVISVLASLMVA